MNIIIISNPTAFCNIFSLCFLFYLYFFEKLSVSGCHFVRKFRKEDRFFWHAKKHQKPKKSTVPSGTAQRMNSAFSVCGGSFAKIHLKSPVEVREIIKPGFWGNFNNGTVSCYQKHGGMIKSKLVDVADKGVVHQLRLRDRERTDLEAAT